MFAVTAFFLLLQILKVHSTEVLRFDMIKYVDSTTGANFGNINNIDYDINLTMGRARIVLVNKFIVSLMVSGLK